MTKCPCCNKYTIAYDGYFGVNKCTVDGCNAIVVDNETYSYIKNNHANKTMDRVEVKGGVYTKVLKRFKML